MDIRARLLLAFTPLLLLLIGITLALPLALGESQTLLQRQITATEDLGNVQSLQMSVLREHDAVAHAVGARQRGEPVSEVEQGRFNSARRQAEALIAQRAAANYQSAPQDAQIASLYGALKRRHDIVLQHLAADDVAAAVSMIEDPTTDDLLDAILDLGQQVQAESRTAFTSVNRTIQASQQATLLQAAIGTLIGVLAALALSWLLVGQVVRPLNRLAGDAELFAAGEQDGELSAGGNIPQVRRLRDSFQQLINANRERQSQLKVAFSELQERVRREEQLRETVQALSLPVVPLSHDTLLLPLVGYLDERRAVELTRGLLDAVQTRRARTVLLDLTGLASLDHDTAMRLQRAMLAARLLGCHVTLVGVRADQALALSELELDLKDVGVARDVPSVLLARNGV